MNFCIKLATQLMLNGIKNGKGCNIVTSLLSLNMLLNMLTVGTKGGTQKQLLKALELDTASEINAMSSVMMATMNTSDIVGGPTLSMAHGVWADHRLSFNPTFKDIVADIYKADIQTFDFANKLDQVVREVNSWAEKETKGLIKNLLSRISRDTNLILASALYFKGVWRDAFEKSLTKENNFYHLSGETTKVPFMTSYYKAQYYKFFDDYKLLKLPYQSGNDSTKEFWMSIYLPHDKNGLENLLQNITSNPQLLHENKNVGLKTLTKTLVPKFKFEYEFEPSDMMKEMGVDLLFKDDRVEMDMIDTAVEEGKDRGSVSKIIQKSFIEVNEKGTEAAAVTVALNNAGSARRNPRPPPPEEFVADHPFFFMIKEDVSGSILFSGVVTNPLMP